eukprot:COSAG06_NODE_2432_length_6887_cov_4.220684_7_plen_59_part_00
MAQKKTFSHLRNRKLILVDLQRVKQILWSLLHEVVLENVKPPDRIAVPANRAITQPRE